MTSPDMLDDSGITWHMVGKGSRAHAFLGDDLRFAYCSLGPGEAGPVAPDVFRCYACAKRIDRIDQQRAERATWDPGTIRIERA